MLVIIQSVITVASVLSGTLKSTTCETFSFHIFMRVDCVSCVVKERRSGWSEGVRQQAFYKW